MASKVAIVGAGWAGLACAIASAAIGAQVDVFERRVLIDDAPLHVDVVPNMMRCLARLGLAEACVRGGFPYRSVTVTDSAGQLRDEIPCIRLAEPHLPVAVGLHGQVLTDALLNAARSYGVRIHLSADVQSISFADDDHASLHIEGRAPVTADLILLATGGEVSCGGTPFEPLSAAEPVTWWCGLVQRPRGLEQPQFVLAGLRSKLWLVPLSGVAAGLSLIGDDLQALTEPTLSSAQAKAWMLAHGCREELVSLAPNDEVFLRPIRVRAGVRPLPWHRGNLLCVGATAHGLPPHFSQPAAQAFEDAVVLGELLAERLAEPSVQPDMPKLLRAFVGRRQPRVQAVFEASARAMQWDRDPNRGIGLKELAASMAAAVAAPA